MFFHSTFFIGLGRPANEKATNLVVLNGPPHMRTLADNNNIE